MKKKEIGNKNPTYANHKTPQKCACISITHQQNGNDESNNCQENGVRFKRCGENKLMGQNAVNHIGVNSGTGISRLKRIDFNIRKSKCGKTNDANFAGN